MGVVCVCVCAQDKNAPKIIIISTKPGSHIKVSVTHKSDANLAVAVILADVSHQSFDRRLDTVNLRCHGAGAVQQEAQVHLRTCRVYVCVCVFVRVFVLCVCHEVYICVHGQKV